MRWYARVLAMALFAVGCQSTHLLHLTNEEAASVTDLYTQEVLDNLAKVADNPSALPYFSVPGTGTTIDQRSLQANYTATWDLITNGPAAMLRLFDRYLLDKQSAYIQPQLTYSEQFQAAPTNNPDKLVLMQIAYHRVLGIIDPQEDRLISLFYAKKSESMLYASSDEPRGSEKERTQRQQYDLSQASDEIRKERYFPALSKTGWFEVGGRKDVPKTACHVGHCGKTYVWVSADHAGDLADFTLAILDIATIANAGQARNRTTGPGLLAPRENFFNPFSSPGPLP